MFGLGGQGKGKGRGQGMGQASGAGQGREISVEKDLVGEIAATVLSRQGPAEPILDYFAKYPNMVFPEWRRTSFMLFHPANLMAYRSHSEVADIINELEALGTKYKCKPQGVHSDKYMRFQLFLRNAEGLLNLSVNGRLIQAETRFIFPDVLAALRRAKSSEGPRDSYAREGVEEE